MSVEVIKMTWMTQNLPWKSRQGCPTQSMVADTNECLDRGPPCTHATCRCPYPYRPLYLLEMSVLKTRKDTTM